jgi:glycosyltransferase involved in cell wall biosynthesis
MTASTPVETVEPIDTVHSNSWPDALPAVSVVIATRNRAGYLAELFDALARQVDAPPFEVLVADDGSTDATWDVLTDLVAAHLMPIAVLRLRPCGGPSLPRNTAIAHSRGRLLALTDDDCLPEPHWLDQLAAAARSGGIVQGVTMPTERGPASAWDRTISIDQPSGLWESCNLALPRELFEAAGGFAVLDLLPRSGRGFGEDTVLGASAARLGGSGFASTAVVRHRWVPSDYLGYLDVHARLSGMPALLARVPELRRRCYLGMFRNRRSAACDLAVAGLTVAALRGRKRYAMLSLPWLVVLSHAAQQRWGRPLPVRMAQEGVADLVATAALTKGSIRTGTPLL